MITIGDLKKFFEIRELTSCADDTAVITDACCCDLLSWVMARGENSMAWVTVQTHLNVIAVASLHDFSCVIVPENISVPENTLIKANEERIPVFSTTLTSYQVCCKLCELKIGY